MLVLLGIIIFCNFIVQLTFHIKLLLLCTTTNHQPPTTNLKTNKLSKVSATNKLSKRILFLVMLSICANEMRGQINPNYAAGHNVVNNNLYQIDTVNRDAIYATWLRAGGKTLSSSADTDCVNMVANVIDDFDDTSITVMGNMPQSTANLHNELVANGADSNILHIFFKNAQVDTNYWGYNVNASLSASYLDQDAVNIVIALLHEALLHGSNIEHNSGKLINIEVNVGTAQNPTWIAFPQDVKTAISDGNIGGNYIQAATTVPANSTADDDDYIYIPHPTTWEANFARIPNASGQLGHSNSALNSMKLLNTYFLANPGKIDNLNDAEVVNVPQFTINTGNQTINIDNPGDYAGNLELIPGSGEFQDDEYSLHFYDSANNVIGGNKRRRFKDGQEISIPVNAVKIAVMNDDQNVKSALVDLEVIDIESPTAPNISISNIQLTSFTATSDGSTDNIGVANTEFYLDTNIDGIPNGDLIATLPNAQPVNYDYTGLSQGTTYEVYTRTADAAGNLSPFSNLETVTTTLGTEDQEIAGFAMYPNPVENSVNIEIDGQLDNIAIYDITGKLVKKIDPQGLSKINIPLDYLSSGTYFIEAHDKEGRKVVKRVLKN